MSDRLGTAKWEDPATISQKYPYAPGTFWLGRAEDGEAVGYKDDRHICLVSGTRGGKGASVIINNLCMWPGSAVVVDPKGENATITAARRGRGSEHCDGMGQAVHVLDPFNAAQVDDSYRSSFNPLDSLDPHSEETRDEANRIASAIIVVRENAAEPFWDEAARDMLRGLILYVLTAKHFMADERNLITVRQLILRGEWQIYEAIRADGHDEEKIDAPHLLLWRSMERSKAFDGLVSGLGSRFRGTMKSEKMYEGILQAAVVNTEFLDSPGMRRVLCKSNFSLKELKTRPEGMTLYLSLPQRFMETHYRWLRMMVALTINEMEIHPGRPQTGHPVLMILDEFAGLKRMTMIENAVAQLAGFGVKLFYVLQSLEQLKGIYKDHWETFVANAGIKIFFSVGDPFTQKYISTMAGETQVTLQQKTLSESRGDSESFARGSSESRSTSRSVSDTKGTSSSITDGTSHSMNTSLTEGANQSRNSSVSTGSNVSYMSEHHFFSPNRWISDGKASISHGTSQGTSEGTSSSVSQGTTDGTSRSKTDGSSESSTRGTTEGKTFSTSETRTSSTSNTRGESYGENIQRRPLIQPDEVGRFFTRIDDKTNPAYPGLGLVMVTGSDPLVVRRTHYFEDPLFMGRFLPHPDHAFLPGIVRSVDDWQSVFKELESYMKVPGDKPNGYIPLKIKEWLVKPGAFVTAGQVLAQINGATPYLWGDGQMSGVRYFAAEIKAPCDGMVTATADLLPAPGHPLLVVKSYAPGQEVDPLGELRKISANVKKERETTLAGPKPPDRPQAKKESPVVGWIGALLAIVVLVAFCYFIVPRILADANKPPDIPGIPSESRPRPAPLTDEEVKKIVENGRKTKENSEREKQKTNDQKKLEY